jgi:hypothetical protein
VADDVRARDAELPHQGAQMRSVVGEANGRREMRAPRIARAAVAHETIRLVERRLFHERFEPIGQHARVHENDGIAFTANFVFELDFPKRCATHLRLLVARRPLIGCCTHDQSSSEKRSDTLDDEASSREPSRAVALGFKSFHWHTRFENHGPRLRASSTTKA